MSSTALLCLISLCRCFSMGAFSPLLPEIGRAGGHPGGDRRRSVLMLPTLPAAIMATDEPRFPTVNPNRIAEERQYLQQPLGPALKVFHRHRDASLMFFAARAEGDWARAGHQMDSRGRRTIDDFLGVMAWHDENHLAQLARALKGEV